MKMYCLTTQDDHYEKIKKLGYLPVGLGNKVNTRNFISDNTKINISKKNSFYGEYTFHYWLWKNRINENEKDWVGFCQYRKFWVIENYKGNIDNLEKLNKRLLKKIPENFDKFDAILGEPLFINQFRFSKFIKKNLKVMVKEPSLFFDKTKRTIKFHFDMMHGKGNLDNAIDLLDKKDRNDFRKFVNSEVSFNPHNMFICKSQSILNNYYNDIFPWLEKCEKEFGFNLEGYGLKRIYGFLAERYLSFWFRKNSKFKTLPIMFKDISELN
tara:strand:+ start:290 stop:1096 length:807 start_codon:yes stop_codon:yes gene_type:complete